MRLYVDDVCLNRGIIGNAFERNLFVDKNSTPTDVRGYFRMFFFSRDVAIEFDSLEWLQEDTSCLPILPKFSWIHLQSLKLWILLGDYLYICVYSCVCVSIFGFWVCVLFGDENRMYSSISGWSIWWRSFRVYQFVLLLLRVLFVFMFYFEKIYIESFQFGHPTEHDLRPRKQCREHIS